KCCVSGRGRERPRPSSPRAAANRTARRPGHYSRWNDSKRCETQQSPRAVALRFERVAGQDCTTLARVGSAAHSIARNGDELAPTICAKSGLCAAATPTSVFTLITSSYLVGACTGRSPGLSPLKIWSTQTVAGVRHALLANHTSFAEVRRAGSSINPWPRPIAGVFRIGGKGADDILRPAAKPVPGDRFTFAAKVLHEVPVAVELRRVS